MSYQALARRYRPRFFHQVLGQDAIVTALMHALKKHKTHHAYLFTGTRGTGKTTLARLLAKGLNCEALAKDGEPCGACGQCNAVQEGHHPDLIEIDAASRTKVEDTRDLLANVPYAPSMGRYKIYLIDEVHMLSSHSFNALLKTLEEPPEHVQFLLCTTEVEKLPITVLSRCLQYRLQHVPSSLLAQHMAHILEQENIAKDEKALLPLAYSAKGSVRDSLSLLDQAIAYGAGTIDGQKVQEMLGLADQNHDLHTLVHIAAEDKEGTLKALEYYRSKGCHYQNVLANMATICFHLSYYQSMGSAYDESFLDTETLGAHVQKFEPNQLQLYYEICQKAQKTIADSFDMQMAFLMTLLRMLSFTPAFSAKGMELAEKPVAPLPSKVASPAPRSQAVAQNNPTKEAAAKVAPERALKRTDQGAIGSIAYPDLFAKLSLSGMAKQLASHCQGVWQDNALSLCYEASYKALCSTSIQQSIKDAINSYFGQEIVVLFALKNDQSVVDGVPSPSAQKQQVQEKKKQTLLHDLDNNAEFSFILDEFNAKIVRESVEITEKE